MSTKRTSYSNNKWGIVSSESPVARPYNEQKSYSGLVLVIGLLIVAAIVGFIVLNWNPESLLLSFVLAYRIRHSDKWCLEGGVSTVKLLENDVLIFRNVNGELKHVENIVELEIAE